MPPSKSALARDPFANLDDLIEYWVPKEKKEYLHLQNLWDAITHQWSNFNAILTTTPLKLGHWRVITSQRKLWNAIAHPCVNRRWNKVCFIHSNTYSIYPNKHTGLMYLFWVLCRSQWIIKLTSHELASVAKNEGDIKAMQIWNTGIQRCLMDSHQGVKEKKYPPLPTHEV